MSYYKDLRRANLKINNYLDSARKNKTELDIKKMILTLTNELEVSNAAIMKRIQLIQSVEKDFDIIDDTIVFK